MAETAKAPAQEAPVGSSAFNLVALAQPVSQKVHIKQINLWDTAISRQPTTPDIAMPFLFDQRFTAEFSRKSESELDVKVKFIWISTANDASIEAKFSIIYEVADLNSHDNEQITAFAKTNGVFNAWPYWREYLQSTSMRLGIAPVTIPAMTILSLVMAYVQCEIAAAATAVASPS